MAGKGINGVGDGKFNPNGKISRQDFAIILAKALNLDTNASPSTATFTDVSFYALKYVEAAYKAGLMIGNGDGTFGATSTLTREQMALNLLMHWARMYLGKAPTLHFRMRIRFRRGPRMPSPTPSNKDYCMAYGRDFQPERIG